jgi:hypothetical protein
MSPGWRELQNGEAVEEARNPRRAGVSAEKCRCSRTSRLRRSGESGAPGPPRPWEKEGRREMARAHLARGRGLPTRLSRCVRVGVGSPGLRGREVPGITRLHLWMEARIQNFGRGWVRGSKAWVEKALEGQKPKRASAVGSGRPVPARTDSQEDEGFEVDEGGGTGRFRRSESRGTGRAALGRPEREPVDAGGTGRPRRRVRKSAKPAATRLRGRVPHASG